MSSPGSMATKVRTRPITNILQRVGSFGPWLQICLSHGCRFVGCMHAGSLGAMGLSLPELMRQRAAATEATPLGRAKSCILLFLMGGPPQHSTWDPKPDAPREIRGEIGPIATNVPGIHIGELMPRL